MKALALLLVIGTSTLMAQPPDCIPGTHEPQPGPLDAGVSVLVLVFLVLGGFLRINI